jgi:hypothetical protein
LNRAALERQYREKIRRSGSPAVPPPKIAADKNCRDPIRDRGFDFDRLSFAKRRSIPTLRGFYGCAPLSPNESCSRPPSIDAWQPIDIGLEIRGSSTTFVMLLLSIIA